MLHDRGFSLFQPSEEFFTVASLRDRFADTVFCPNPFLRIIRVNAIIKEIAASVVPKRPGRTVPRKKARRAKYHPNKKSNV